MILWVTKAIFSSLTIHVYQVVKSANEMGSVFLLPVTKILDWKHHQKKHDINK